VVCSTSVGIENEWFESGGGGHFDSLVVARVDTGGDASVCGDLDCDGRDRTLSLAFASSGAVGDYPYNYLWRRGRGLTVGDTTEQLWNSVASPHTGLATGVQPMPLKTVWDGVGAILILSDESVQLTDSAFLYGSYDYGPAGKIEYALQHWREIQAPDLTSAGVDGTTVTLSWTNHHHGRPIDSTIVFRGGQERARLGHAIDTWADSGVAQGTYTYRLKHWTRPVVWHEGQLAYPNSAASDGIAIEIDTATPPPPDPLAMYVAGPDLITEDDWYGWTMATSDGTPPYGPHRWEYKAFGTSTWTLVGEDSTYTRYVQTTDSWFWLRAAVWDAGDPTDSVVNRRVAVETWDGGGAAPTLLATQIGVRLNDGTCSPRPPVGDPGRQAWLQMIMETVRRIAYCTVDPRAS
jgi:hypothetical protein